MKTLVTKLSDTFIEPCCSQKINTEEKHALFSSDVWAAYAYLKKRNIDCDFQETRPSKVNELSHVLSEYSHLLFFSPFPMNRNILDGIVGVSGQARKAGVRLIIAGRNPGYIDEMLKTGIIDTDVYISAYDTQKALGTLLDEGFFRNTSPLHHQAHIANKDAPYREWTHRDASFLDVADEVKLHDYFSLPNQRKQRALTAGVGCPYGCTYCTKRRTGIQGKRPETLAAEIGFWKTMPLEVYHNNLFTNRLWLEELLASLSAYAPNKGMRTLGRIDDMSKALDLLPAMGRVGFNRIDVGLESASEKVLADMGKLDNDLGQAGILFDEAQKHGIKIQFNLLLGMPEEDEDSIRKTFEAFQKYGTTLNISLLRPYPGTPVHDKLQCLGILPDNGHTFMDFLEASETFKASTPHVPTKYLSKDELQAWHRRFKEYAESVHG